MSLKLRFRNGDALASHLASALGFDPEGIYPVELDICREFAFSSSNSEEFAHWYLRSEVFSKFANGDPDVALFCEEEAYRKFYDAEKQCSVANERLVAWPWSCSVNTKVIQEARGIVFDVLGSFPWEQFPRFCSHGTGASTGLPRRKSSASNKWELNSHVTEAAEPYFDAFQKWSGFNIREPAIAGGNRVTTVPKSYKVDRVIAIEPSWNLFFQRGIGSLIRNRVQNKLGLLRPDAQFVHQRLAKEGSVTGRLATLDLSAASDTVNLAICEALLPPSWFKVLCDLRSKRGYMADGTVVDYAKLSSMGNGFTFELETLIFYALTAACFDKGCRNEISVYGDDIVCPANKAEQVMECLQDAGFTINRTKSFWKGPFRESCGGHFWFGQDVTPYYLRHPVKTFGDSVTLHNNLLEWRSRRETINLTPAEASLRDALVKTLPRALRGPWGVAGCAWSQWDECHPTWNRNTQSYKQTVVKTIKWLEDDGANFGAYLQKLWVVGDTLETSWTSKSDTMEVWGKTGVYNDQWGMWPVR